MARKLPPFSPILDSKADKGDGFLRFQIGRSDPLRSAAATKALGTAHRAPCRYHPTDRSRLGPYPRPFRYRPAGDFRVFEKVHRASTRRLGLVVVGFIALSALIAGAGCETSLPPPANQECPG